MTKILVLMMSLFIGDNQYGIDPDDYLTINPGPSNGPDDWWPTSSWNPLPAGRIFIADNIPVGIILIEGEHYDYPPRLLYPSRTMGLGPYTFEGDFACFPQNDLYPMGMAKVQNGDDMVITIDNFGRIIPTINGSPAPSINPDHHGQPRSPFDPHISFYSPIPNPDPIEPIDP